MVCGHWQNAQNARSPEQAATKQLGSPFQQHARQGNSTEGEAGGFLSAPANPHAPAEGGKAAGVGGTV